MLGSDLVFIEQLSKKRRRIGIVGLENGVFEFEQGQGKQLADKIWPSSLVLSQYLVDIRLNRHVTNCIEVGCGLGLVSLVTSAMGIHTLATDIVAPTHLPNGPFLSSSVFDFTINSFPFLGHFDILLASDIIYSGVVVEELAETIHSILQRFKTMECLLCQQIRNPDLELKFFNDILPALGMTVKEIQYSPSIYESSDVEHVSLRDLQFTRIYEIKLDPSSADTGFYL